VTSFDLIKTQKLSLPVARHLCGLPTQTSPTLTTGPVASQVPENSYGWDIARGIATDTNSNQRRITFLGVEF